LSVGPTYKPLNRLEEHKPRHSRNTGPRSGMRPRPFPTRGSGRVNAALNVLRLVPASRSDRHWPHCGSLGEGWHARSATRLRSFSERKSPDLCRFLGRLDDEPVRARRREASEKRQGTESRLVGRRRCSGLYGDLAAAGMVGMADWTGEARLVGRPGVAGRAECVWRRCLALAVSQVRCPTRRAGSPPADDRGSEGAALRGVMRAAVMTCRS
jgi:hypothetical protein